MIPHHRVAGPAGAPALVLSNSLGSTLAMWEPQLRTLTERFRVVRYDLRGHGRSATSPPPAAIDDLGRDVVELLDHLGLATAHLCGASIGGMASMWVASRAPERVVRLTLCCSSARFGTPEQWFERAALVRAEGTAAVADAVVGRWFTPGYASAHPHVVTRMREMIASTPREGYAASCEVVATADLRPDLGSIGAATLVVAGTQDPAVPAADVKTLAAGIPQCEVERVDAAHLANVECPERVTDLILRHIFADEEAS